MSEGHFRELEVLWVSLSWWGIRRRFMTVLMIADQVWGSADEFWQFCKRTVGRAKFDEGVVAAVVRDQTTPRA